MKLEFTDIANNEVVYCLRNITRVFVPKEMTRTHYMGTPEAIKKEFGVDGTYRDAYIIEVLVGDQHYKHPVDQYGRENILEQLGEAEIT